MQNVLLLSIAIIIRQDTDDYITSCYVECKCKIKNNEEKNDHLRHEQAEDMDAELLNGKQNEGRETLAFRRRNVQFNRHKKTGTTKKRGKNRGRKN
jgi:hypothetical protein